MMDSHQPLAFSVVLPVSVRVRLVHLSWCRPPSWIVRRITYDVIQDLAGNGLATISAVATSKSSAEPEAAPDTTAAISPDPGTGYRPSHLLSGCCHVLVPFSRGASVLFSSSHSPSPSFPSSALSRILVSTPFLSLFSNLPLPHSFAVVILSFYRLATVSTANTLLEQ